MFALRQRRDNVDVVVTGAASCRQLYAPGPAARRPQSWQQVRPAHQTTAMAAAGMFMNILPVQMRPCPAYSVRNGYVVVREV